MRAARGYTLVLVMAMIGGLGLGAAVAFDRVRAAHSDEREVERRAQLLWLARTAVLAGKRGESAVMLGGERVVVRATSQGASAVHGASGATAAVTLTGGEWIERYAAGAVAPR